MGCGASSIAPAPSSATEGGVVSLTASDREAAARVIGNAFAGTPTAAPEWAWHWVMGPTMSDRAEPQRAATMQYMHGWNIFATSGAHILGIRAPDGELQAAVVCWKSPGGSKGVGTSVCGALTYISKDFDGTHKPLPLYMKSRKLIDKRLNALIKAQKSMKQEHAPGPHYYISAVAVEPTAQGTKLGSKLMAAVAAMADADGLPCYTEVSGSTRDVYAHLGYEEKAVYTVSIAGEEAEHAPFGELYAMVRPPKGAK